ncbi:MAG: hypothetical protein IJ060_00110 [Oscillospiraceae bacterium]|nr:hypothetical protein [Oscillospiraceae bacterium]
MKIKKLLAILSAVMLGCCALGGTAFAEETEPVDYSQYQLGDINLDGEVDIEDAQIAQQFYTDYYLAKKPLGTTLASHGITEEQLKLGDIINYTNVTDYPVTIEDAYLILSYYTDQLSLKAEGDTISVYVRKLIQAGKYRSDVVVND